MTPRTGDQPDVVGCGRRSRTTTTTYAPTATAADLGKLGPSREVKTVNGATVLAQTRSPTPSAAPIPMTTSVSVSKQSGRRRLGHHHHRTTHARVASVTDVHDDLTRTDARTR